MTEQEYIDVSDLQKIDAARRLLRRIVPENSSVVKRGELAVVYRQLNDWADKLYAKIEVIK